MTDKRSNCNIIPTIPWMPVIEDISNSKTEVTDALEYVKYPKLLEDHSWTKAVPYKYWFSYTKPSEGIGSIYTPTSAHYRINNLTLKKKSSECLPFGIKNKLRMPPREYVEFYKEEIRRKRAEKDDEEEEEGRNILPDNIINLKDLADGTWSHKKAEKEANRDIRNKELLNKRRKDKLKRKISEEEIMRSKEAEMPRSIEDQLEELMIRVEKEQNQIIRDEDIQRLLYLRNECIDDYHLEPYDYSYINNAIKLLVGRLRKREDFDSIIKKLEMEIINDYKNSLRYSIVDYILLDSEERKRLLIETMPMEYPVMIIRAPVPWHQYKILAYHFMEYNLFLTNEILRDIRDLWFSKYHKKTIFEIQDLGKFPVPATEIEPKINELCKNAVNMLTNKWLADVADIFIEKKYAWSGLFEKDHRASTKLIEKYFRTVNSLLSRQLRIMIMKTIRKLRNFLMQYKMGNYFEGDYNDLMFIKPPFITVNVEVEIGTTSLYCKPSILDIHTIISRCFDKILNVAMILPKIEVILFPELDDKGFLFSVSRYEDEVLLLITDTLDTIRAHIIGPQEYLKRYQELLYIVDGTAEKNLNDFFNIEPFPFLREFEQKINFYDNLSKEISMFQCKIPLNMIEIDCTIVNDTMRQILHKQRSQICDYFVNELRSNNRELCSIFDEIAENISKMPETTQEVVELYNYLCESRDSTMFNLRSRLSRSADLTLFLFNHQPLTDDDIQLNSRTITWPKEMETVMDLATTRLNMRKEFLEEEMEQATEEVEQLSKVMAEIRKESEEINEEETLLDMELSPYMMIPPMSSIVDVFDKLWHIALTFHKNYEKWFYGPFVGLDADEIRDEVEDIWRTLYKLSRVLSDIPGARRVAEMVRAKVEKFKQFVPVLQTILYRVFHDRLVDDDDREMLFSMVKHTCYEHLRQPLEKVLAGFLKEDEKIIKSSHIRDLFFGNYIEPDADPKVYDEVTNLDDLQKKMDYYLNEYNMVSKSPMSLVLFRFAIEHISRVSRVLLQDNGHALLVGIGGSGRNSCTKLATSMCEYVLYQIEMSRSYGYTEWQDDLRQLLLRIGCDGKPTVFLFGDNQITDESFVEDINILLNTGDVPNLYGTEEMATILEKMMNVAREQGGKKMETTPLTLYNLFIERIKKNLHIVLTMSPIGDTFRNRTRMFPSLINCCTIDWYTLWPEDALEKVARSSLKNLDISSELREKCVHICKEFHTSVFIASEDYYKNHHRRYYVTPTSFLQLISSLYRFYGEKVDQITNQESRYVVGLEKLDFAAGQVAVMQDELKMLQPKLVAQSQLSDKLMIRIEQDTINVEARKEIVAADEALANEAAAAAQAIKDDCESDLAEATPALEAALAALNTLKPADITIVKSMKSPPAGVRLVMEAVCVLKGVKPEKVQDPKTGKTVEDYWLASIRMLGDMKFLDSLKNFDKDNIPPAYMKVIREKFINDRSFQPEVIKKVSTACEGLCKWVRAMEVYDRVIKVVAPKRAMLAEAEAELAVQMEMLNAKRTLLQEVTQKLQSLNDEFAECMREKKKLEDQIDHCTQKLDRAEKLLGGLSGEKTRWNETALALGASLQNVIGDVLLSSGVVAYLGAFTIDYRNDLINKWHGSCTRANIPCSKHFSLINILGEPVTIRSWTIHGLPDDNFSIENGIIVKNADRWPLMIDPQNQANKWVKNMEKQNKLSVIKLTDPNYVNVVETALQLGMPVLLENILEDIDAILEPVLLKNIYKQRGISYIKFGENVLEYNRNFRLYITTRLRNPHYLPEIVVKVTLLNFMITPQGLEDQLLGIVVAQELPILEEKKNQLIVEGANNRRILKEIEDKILEVLSTSEGNILEDETAIKILSTSKVLSEDIEAKQDAAAKTAIEIDQARDGYKPVSKHGSVLFFCISELGNVDPMYQYSLTWFIHLYIMSITNSEQSIHLNVRLNNLNSHFTANIYRNVCRSLFEKHKLMFSLILCVGLMRAEKKLNEDLWTFLLTGGVGLDNPYPNPAPFWLSDKSWSEVVQATALPGMEKFKMSLEKYTSIWKDCYDLSNPEKETLPIPFEHLDGRNLDKLIIIRCIRPDKILATIQTFIIENMDQSYVEPPPFDLQGSYNDSSNITPLIFILSPGSDPMAGLIKFAEDNGLSKKDLMTISLGQGQGPIATNMIKQSILSGEWVILQNCHLAVSWMKELDRICDEIIIPENTHPNFRLWLTSYPSEGFPVSILQNGVKITNEPPKGLKNNLLRSYLNDPISDMKFFLSCSKILEWRSLLFSLCFFHAVVQERRNFGPLGWNIPYEFNESDLRISILQLQLFLNDYDDIPFDALLYLTGECNYGGRVTDDKDRRLLNSLLTNFYNPEIVTNRKYSFSPSGIYHLPKNTDYEGCIDYIRNLPINQTPEVYGLHDNADITKDNQESMQLLADAILTQPQISGVTAERDIDELVHNLAADILSKIPALFDMVEVEEKYPVLYMNSMNTVLRQELIKFNQLINVIKDTLINVQKAIKGQVLMSPELEEVFTCMSIGKVPSAWDRKSYPSLKPLGSYVNDLLARILFLQDWIDNDAPVVFWISGFFFTQSFLTGVLQNYARKHKIPIDLIEFDFEVTKFETTVDGSPLNGVYIRVRLHNSVFFLEGARWNRETVSLDESKPKVMFDSLPIIWLIPTLKSELQFPPIYRCPIYKTSARRGILATTGHSSNFVMYIFLPTTIDESHWINRGVASLCQLDD
ncbi:hypothetical protein M0802_004599 [Mischocyttarus mexicanus]|nr:hypothetical protein M0802_004599 [Mischocyttarus mexicanus]